MNKRSRRNIILTMILFTFTIVMCRCYYDDVGAVQLPSGSTCRAYRNYEIFNSGSGFECSLVCPDGRASNKIDVPDLASLETLRATLCGLPVSSPTLTIASPTLTETISVAETASTPLTPTITSTPAPVLPLLTGQMTGCGNLGSPAEPAWWVNLRLAEPHLDIIGKNLEVTIGGIPSPCGINQGNPSLLTCFASKGITYPAPVVVKLEGVEVNNFTVNPNQSICTPSTATRSEQENPAPASTTGPGQPPATQPPITTTP
jgi:hypothetical protein